VACLNRLLQQNPPQRDIDAEQFVREVRRGIQADHMRSFGIGLFENS